MIGLVVAVVSLAALVHAGIVALQPPPVNVSQLEIAMADVVGESMDGMVRRLAEAVHALIEARKQATPIDPGIFRRLLLGDVYPLNTSVHTMVTSSTEPAPIFDRAIDSPIMADDSFPELALAGEEQAGDEQVEVVTVETVDDDWPMEPWPVEEAEQEPGPLIGSIPHETTTTTSLPTMTVSDVSRLPLLVPAMLAISILFSIILIVLCACRPRFSRRDKLHLDSPPPSLYFPTLSCNSPSPSRFRPRRGSRNATDIGNEDAASESSTDRTVESLWDRATRIPRTRVGDQTALPSASAIIAAF